MPIAVAALGGNAIVGESDVAAVDLGRAPLALARLVVLGCDSPEPLDGVEPRAIAALVDSGTAGTLIHP